MFCCNKQVWSALGLQLPHQWRGTATMPTVPFNQGAPMTAVLCRRQGSRQPAVLCHLRYEGSLLRNSASCQRS